MAKRKVSAKTVGVPLKPIMTCPYTGEGMRLVFLPWSGVYTVRGGFDPAAWQDGLKLEAVMRGASKGELRCAYTGREVSLVRRGSLSRADGAFSPAQVWADKEAAEYAVSIRGGVLPAFPALRPVAVGGYERRRESDPSEGAPRADDALVAHMVDKLVVK